MISEETKKQIEAKALEWAEQGEISVWGDPDISVMDERKRSYIAGATAILDELLITCWYCGAQINSKHIKIYT